MDWRVEESWEAEYQAGRYEDEAPVGFVHDIVAAAHEAGLGGELSLYVGCGNGRNYLPLVHAGLDLVGLDISRTALRQLTRRAPDRRHRLVKGDLSTLPADSRYGVVIGIQVFQHGDRSATHSHVRAAQERVAPGGLFCLRVNAVGTDVFPQHEVTERHEDGGFTVRYLEGPKEGLEIHFFSLSEIMSLLRHGFEEVLPLRVDQTWRSPLARGQWGQWETIWRRRADSALS